MSPTSRVPTLVLGLAIAAVVFLCCCLAFGLGALIWGRSLHDDWVRSRQELGISARPAWSTVLGRSGRFAMSLTVNALHRGDVVVVSIAGELDMGTAPPLQQQVSELLAEGHHRLVFDLSEVAFCDSTGLSVFVRAKNSCDEVGGVVRLAAPQRGMMRILQVSGLVEVLQTYPTVEAAVTDESSSAVPAE